MFSFSSAFFVSLDNPAMLDGVLRQEKETELSTLQGGRMKQCKKLLRLLYAEDTYAGPVGPDGVVTAIESHWRELHRLPTWAPPATAAGRHRLLLK